jgi:hypothetical protein
MCTISDGIYTTRNQFHREDGARVDSGKNPYESVTLFQESGPVSDYGHEVGVLKILFRLRRTRYTAFIASDSGIGDRSYRAGDHVQAGSGNSIMYFVNNTFYYPTHAESYTGRSAERDKPLF